MYKSRDNAYGISMDIPPMPKSSRILPGQMIPNQQQFTLPHGHSRLDMYNKTGKISRSYSENDFQHYYQHSNLTYVNQQQNPLKTSNNLQQNQTKESNIIGFPSQDMRRNSVLSSGMNQNLKTSNAGSSSNIIKNTQLRQSQ